ncbi:hypothetical protein D3C78_1821170 [compost metagenome]
MVTTKAFRDQCGSQVRGLQNLVGAQPQTAVDIAVVRFGRQLLFELDDKAEAQKRRIVRCDPLVQLEE